MEKILVQTPSGFYPIYFGPQIWAEIIQFASDFEDVLLVTDTNVGPLYADRLPFESLTIMPGEEQKTLATLELILNHWAQCQLTRQSLVIALGGGVIGDLTGFAAAIYQRGIAYLQVPTTLLAQVDSSVGGKTAVNALHGKNLIGSIYQPRGVFIDPSVLKTLPKREITNGLGEILKYGIIFDHTLFKLVTKNLERFYTLDLDFIEPILYRCCEIKNRIVSQDEQDQAMRKILNHGHTIGHGLEALTKYQYFTHGEAVIWGMHLEAKLAHLLGILSTSNLAEIETGLAKVETLPPLPKIVPQDLTQCLLQDKKNRNQQISFLLAKDFGQIEEVLLTPRETQNYLERVLRG